MGSLYVLVLSEGEINSIEEIRVDDKVVTFDGALSDNTQGLLKFRF